MNPLIQLRTTTLPLLTAFVLSCLTLAPRAQAVVPEPDGGYPNGNTAEGTDALFNLTTGVDNTATGDNNIDIGNDGVADEANTIRIGTSFAQNPSIFQNKTFIAGINGAAVMGIAVKVNAAGQLGTAPSAARFKQNSKPMDKISEAILALKPVSFHYKKELDPEGVQQFGLVAEEAEKVNPALVVCDADGKPYTVRYEAVNAMLLNEFLKEHRKLEQLKSTVAKQEAIIAKQQKGMEALAAHLKEQDSKIQKVTDQLEVNKPAPQMVLNR
jgi:hypothetical protein